MSAARYHGVVLAAGASRRFGGPRPKQLVEIDGEPLVRRATRCALDAGLARVAVVVGHEAAAVRRAVRGLAVAVVENRRWEEGQSTSVRTGLAAVVDGAEAVVFIPCDQPFLTAGVIDRLIAEHAASGGPIVVPVQGGRRASPVLIDRALFPALAAISGDAGGRQLFGDHPVVEVVLDDDSPLLDFDTPAALDRLLRARDRRSGSGSSSWPSSPTPGEDE